jgi:ubiquitin-like modifier-activating enzyme ATG7
MLLFQTLNSSVNVAFWYEFAKKKLEVYKLKEDPIPVYGYYSIEGHVDLPVQLQLDIDSFSADLKVPTNSFLVPGTMVNMNTIESFKALNKVQLLDTLTQEIFNDVQTGKFLDEPSKLNKFLLVSYADIKKYIFYYHFAFPALVPDQFATVASEPKKITETYSEQQIAQLKEQVLPLFAKGSPFLLVDPKSLGVSELGALSNLSAMPVLLVADPSAHPSALGWPTRTLLWALQSYCSKNNKTIDGPLRVIAWRHHRGGNINASNPELHSVVFDVKLPELSKESLEKCPKAVGWEKDLQSKMRPRVLNLAQTMDPVRLSSSAADLNLKLMSWRQFGGLQLSDIQSTKCLLFGAGTLGCNVARSLLAWGVRHITFVDNGKVSYSNPVRQSLFTLEDCLNGGKQKAVAAAHRMKEIFPALISEGHVMTIPMPGHVVSSTEENQTKETVDKIESLIDSHDVIFLLTDSRESRWLPTMLCRAKDKLVLNAALGFDTFVVMRHGVLGTNPRLGCYFCNDVVVPTDSLSNRTLDQQCTVTRPGLSSVASALAVELLVSLIHHPLKAKAPASEKADPQMGGDLPTDLGLVPHQLRGFLTHFSNMIVTSEHYDKCVACSDAVIYEYKKRGFAFLMEAFNSPKSLEDLTGITKMKEESANLDVDWEIGSDNDDF